MTLQVFNFFPIMFGLHGRTKPLDGGAIAQSVKQWSRIPVTRVRNQVDALVPFGKALILITRSLGEDLKPSVVWLLYLQAFMLS